MMANTNESKAVVDMLSGNAPLDTAAFDKFFNTMMFPLFTQWQDVKAGGKTYSPLLNIAPMVAPPKCGSDSDKNMPIALPMRRRRRMSG